MLSIKFPSSSSLQSVYLRVGPFQSYEHYDQIYGEQLWQLDAGEEFLCSDFLHVAAQHPGMRVSFAGEAGVGFCVSQLQELLKNAGIPEYTPDENELRHNDELRTAVSRLNAA